MAAAAASRTSAPQKKKAATTVAAKAVAKVAAKPVATRKKAAAKKGVLGIDIGGSGIKGAPVDLATGELLAERLRIPTPNPSSPKAVAAVVKEICDYFAPLADGPVGVTFPGVVTGGVTRTAANVDKKWIGLDADALFERTVGRPFSVINDAQAAVMAEVRYGAGRHEDGMVLMLTFGTGIGSGLAYRGVSMHGVELGHIRINGVDAEVNASANARDREGWTYKQWVKRVNEYLEHVETILWPDLIILGGGVSEKADKWVPQLKTRARVEVAQLTNEAGIVGAAIVATQGHPALNKR
jgi:polyphosphate glucokinase